MTEYVIIFENRPEYKGCPVYLAKEGIGQAVTGIIDRAQTFDDLGYANSLAELLVHPDTFHLKAEVVETHIIKSTRPLSSKIEPESEFDQLMREAYMRVQDHETMERTK